MNLQEQINRIQSMMGIIIEDKDKYSSAPWGIIFDGDDKILVGDNTADNCEGCVIVKDCAFVQPFEFVTVTV